MIWCYKLRTEHIPAILVVQGDVFDGYVRVLANFQLVHGRNAHGM